ncbi:carbohydrate ABC transporter permease [Streptomyces sp. CA-106131]|uniref:carbohydrate ABC transporter permease n=1 Tax=Streptomyces sp. CA-106131 TaxID=3240045 RepID=UPI003D8F2B44
MSAVGSAAGDAWFSKYVRVLRDPVFLTMLRNTAIFSLTIFIQIGLGFVLAFMLHSAVRGKTIYRLIIFLPVVLSPAILAPIFRQSLAPDGEFNTLLRATGLGAFAHPWLADPNTALWALIVINIWQWTGFSFLLYYAALGETDREVVEAARLDGAGNARLMWSILLPSARGVTLTLIILGVIGVLKTFDIPYLVTGGGPYHATEFFSTYIYSRGIIDGDLGFGSALSVLLLVLSVIFTAYQLARYRRGGQ